MLPPLPALPPRACADCGAEVESRGWCGACAQLTPLPPDACPFERLGLRPRPALAPERVNGALSSYLRRWHPARLQRFHAAAALEQRALGVRDA
ncbi:MAG: hypothetical protein FJ138_09220, partial [Deltaproteobacteria bacterium]|nr:hypothetical protein [Deltaproteobacteria bacterium]